MYIEERAVVEEIFYEDEDVQLLKTSSSAHKAILYPRFIPRVKVGDEVIVNSTATSLKLGTGGLDIVVSVVGSAPFTCSSPSGHIMKTRYLPSQHSVLAVESQESPFHNHFLADFSLKGKNIILAELHSMLPVCFWTMDYFLPTGKMAVIISDEASLPLSLSQHVRALKSDKRFTTITIGQAFGGTYEAINLATALQFATEVLDVDVIVVTLGPGVVGSGTYYGFSGVALSSWANLIGSLDGKPIWVPRLSCADKRKRHFGLSHHTLTPLKKLTYASCDLPLPAIDNELGIHIRKQSKKLSVHNVHWVSTSLFEEIIQHCLLKSPITLSTMGRNYDDDPLFFYGILSTMQFFFRGN